MIHKTTTCRHALFLLAMASLLAQAQAQTLTLTADTTAPVVGTAVKLTAVGKTAAGKPTTSTIRFFDPTSNTTLVSIKPSSTGSATYTTAVFNTVGVSKQYQASNNLGVVSSNKVTVTVAKAPAKITWGTASSVSAGQSGTVSVTLTGYQPTGTVTLRNTQDGTACTGTVSTSTTARTASCSLLFPTAGTKTLEASYAGDNNNLAAISASAVTVQKATANLTWGPLPEASVGNSAVFAATVTGQNPTGSVTFTNATNGGSCTAAVNTVTRVASCGLTFSSVGSKTVNAVYSGDANNLTKTVSTTVVVKSATAVSLSSPVVVRWAGSNSVDLTATLGVGNPAGSMQFLSVRNGVETVLQTVMLNGNRSVSVRVALPGVGLHQVTAKFLGDATQASSMSAALNIMATTPMTDDGASVMSSRLHVDVAAPDCTPGSCGSLAQPYRNLKQAFDALTPGMELIVAGRAGFAYYVENHGALPASNIVPQQFLTLPAYPDPTPNPRPEEHPDALADVTNPTTDPGMANTLVRAWAGEGASRPVVRGTVKVAGWQRVGTEGYLYARSWDVKAQGLADEIKDATGTQVIGYNFTTVMRPQQIYRDLPTGAVKLQQVGGVLYNQGSYNTVSPGAIDFQQSFQWPQAGGDSQRPIGRIAPAPVNPWLSLAENQFYVHAPLKTDGINIDNKQPVTIYVKLGSELPPNEPLEVSVQQFLLNTCVQNVGCAANLTIKDLVFERSNGSAFSPQNTAVILAGESVKAEAITVQDADAVCVTLWGKRVTLRDSTIERCGQLGVAASGSGHVIDHNWVRYNNDKGFNENWAAGGMKFISKESLTQSWVTNNEVSFNDGTGIWLDTDPDYIYIEGNRIGMNGRAVQQTEVNGKVVTSGGVIGFGVHLEIVNNNTVRTNTIVGNANAGVFLIGTGSNVTHNFIAANMGAGLARPGDKRLAETGNCPLSNSGNAVNHNLFAWNDEVVRNPDGGVNKVSMARTVADASNSNVFCGTSTSMSSMAVNTDGRSYCEHAGPAFFDIDSWRSVTGQDAQSVRKTAEFAADHKAQIKSRDPAFWETVLSGAYQVSTGNTCSWPVGWDR